MLAKRVISTFIVKVSASVCSYLVSILLIRQGGAELAGEFFSWLAYLLLASSIIRFGLDHKIVKEITQTTGNELDIVLGKALSLCFFGGIITLPILYILAIYFQNSSHLMAAIIAFSCFIFSIVYLLGNVFQGLNRAGLTILSQEVFIWMALFIFLITYDSINIFQAWSLYLLGVLISLFISCGFLVFKYNLKPKKSNYNELKSYAKETLPYFSAIVGHVALQWCPLIFLSLLSHPEDAGYFVAIQRTSMLIAFLLGVFNLVTNPIYASYFINNNFNDVGKLARAISLLMFFVSLPLLLILVLFGDVLIGLYGEEFKILKDIFVVMAIAQLFNAVTGSAAYILTMGGRAKLVEKSIVVTLSFMVFVGPVLTFYYDVWGAGITSALSVIIFNSINIYLLYKYMSINIIPNKISLLYLLSFLPSIRNNR
jgi:O-antigen/teichoic acid export membrane protein